MHNELKMSLDHQNLVVLKGFCPRLGALVYEYMEGGTLEAFISSEQLRRQYGVRRRVEWAVNVA